MFQSQSAGDKLKLFGYKVGNELTFIQFAFEAMMGCADSEIFTSLLSGRVLRQRQLRLRFQRSDILRMW